MRFCIVLAVVAALTALASAADADTDGCPLFCLQDVDCATCEEGHRCVSMSSLYLIK